MAFKDIVIYLGLETEFEIKIFILFLVFIGIMFFWYYMNVYYELVRNKYEKFARKKGYEYIKYGNNLLEIEKDIGIFKKVWPNTEELENVMKFDNSIFFTYRFQFRDNSIIDWIPQEPRGLNSYVVFEKKLKNKTPNFYLKKENLDDKIDEKLFNFVDIDFIEDKKFSKKYFLRGRNIEEVKVFFNKFRREELLKINISNGFQFAIYPFKLDYSIQVKNNVLYVYIYVGSNNKLFFNLDRFINNCKKLSDIFE